MDPTTTLLVVVGGFVLGPLLTRLLDLWKGGKASGTETAELKAAVNSLNGAVAEFRAFAAQSATDRGALRLEFVELKAKMDHGDEAGRRAGEGLAEMKGEMREAHRQMGNDVSGLRAEIAAMRAEFTTEIAHLNARFEKFLFEVVPGFGSRDIEQGRRHANTPERRRTPEDDRP